MAGYTVEIDIDIYLENGHDVKVLDFITGNYITEDCQECDDCEECSRYDDIKFNIGRELSDIDLNETDDAEIETIVRDTLGDDYGVHHGTYVHRD